VAVNPNCKIPAVARGRIVNRVFDEPSEQLHQRRDASDFDTITQDKVAARGSSPPSTGERPG
jgi:GST-like protein